MRRLLITFLALITCASVALSQQSQEVTPKASAPQPTAEQQKAVVEALAKVEKADAEKRAAEERLELERTRAQMLIYQIMAILRISPVEFRPVLSEAGELRFEKISPPPLPSPK